MPHRTWRGDHAYQWRRTPRTRRALLDAAAEVFADAGFNAAGVADVAARANCSVGSLYHHFGGKTELFLALWEDHHRSLMDRAAGAVALARADGEADPLALLATGTRAYLAGSWERREFTRLFGGDVPPGFGRLRRQRAPGWRRQNAVLLGAGDDPIDRITVGTVTALAGEAGHEVAGCASKPEATAIADATVRLIRRLARS